MKILRIRQWSNLLLSIIAICTPMLVHAAPPGFLWGMCASTRDGDQAFTIMKQLGVQSIRTDVPWNQVEIAKGQYSIPNWVESTVSAAIVSGMKPVLILDYGNPLYTDNDKPLTPSQRLAFASYASFVVNHFVGKVKYFELWNEWETHTGDTTPGTAQEYIELAKVVYPALKKANPNAKILAGGVSDLYLSQINTGYIAEFLRGGGMNYADGLSLHPYNQPGDDGTPETAIEVVDAVYILAKSVTGNASVPIYITEMGYSSYAGNQGVSTQDEANYLARFMVMAASRSYLQGVWWYNLKDVGIDPDAQEDHFGLLSPDLSPKPAADMYIAVTSSISSSSQTNTSLAGTTYTSIVEGNAESQLITWSKNHNDVMTALLSNPTALRPLIGLSVRPTPVNTLHVTVH